MDFPVHCTVNYHGGHCQVAIVTSMDIMIGSPVSKSNAASRVCVILAATVA
jgi:hypothetical protein